MYFFDYTQLLLVKSIGYVDVFDVERSYHLIFVAGKFIKRLTKSVTSLFCLSAYV